MAHDVGFGWEINTGAFGVPGHTYAWEGGTTTTQDPVPRSPVPECWRSFSMYLWFPVDVFWTPTHRLTDEDGNTVGIRWKAELKSQCENLCGKIEKKCLCPYTGDNTHWEHHHHNPEKGEPGYKKCRRWRVTKFEKMHDLCPPQKECSPDWEIDPFPRDCPDSEPIAFELIAETDWDGAPGTQPPLPDEGMIHNTIFSQMRDMTDELIKLLESAPGTYNMKCDGGPIDPPDA